MSRTELQGWNNISLDKLIGQQLWPSSMNNPGRIMMNIAILSVEIAAILTTTWFFCQKMVFVSAGGDMKRNPDSCNNTLCCHGSESNTNMRGYGCGSATREQRVTRNIPYLETSRCLKYCGLLAKFMWREVCVYFSFHDSACRIDFWAC